MRSFRHGSSGVSRHSSTRRLPRFGPAHQPELSRAVWRTSLRLTPQNNRVEELVPFIPMPAPGKRCTSIAVPIYEVCVIRRKADGR